MTEPDKRQWEGFMVADHAPETHAHVQWKGTDICMDFRCECGADGHLDGCFIYAVKCKACGAIWELPINIFPRRVQSHDMLVEMGDDDDRG